MIALMFVCMRGGEEMKKIRSKNRVSLSLVGPGGAASANAEVQESAGGEMREGYAV